MTEAHNDSYPALDTCDHVNREERDVRIGECASCLRAEVAALRAELQEAVVLMERGVEFIGRCAIDHDDLAAFDVEAKMLKMLGREATHA